MHTAVSELPVQDDGSGLAVTASGGLDNDILVSRVTTEGMLDPTFGVDGVARIERQGMTTPRTPLWTAAAISW